MIYLIFVTIFFPCDCYIITNTEKVTLETVHEPIPVNIGRFPLYWDWREHNKVTPVKSQQDCNACWAFSAIANIESQLMIYMNKTESLSEQFLIDCDGRNIGCGNANLLTTFSTIVDKLGGVLRYNDYKPYKGRVTDCAWNKITPLVPVIGYRRVRNDEGTMAIFLYQYGPLSAGINSASMKIYNGGIDEPSDEICPPDQPDHAVLIVGFNIYIEPITGKSVPYWIIKNSWSTNWGDKGYYYLVRGRNACGIANDVSFSIVN
ncbi:unnamed protein product [Euphydryas editha]|uniref:Peptidase C1A papain C-terminal domain-containing protein n=1 Tax=Euphydryas editha TaxID=104508 RepID=A0AAU9TEH4_EUPED|nr:unnamed protein product [Euphydryas editha]